MNENKDEERRFFVYMHVNKIDGKRYIGITGRPKPQWRWGQRGQKYNDTQYFYNAIQKYGWDNFDHIILYEKLTEKEAKAKEIELIAKYKANDRKYGYNLTAGGDDGSHLRGEKSPLYGKHFSEEHRRKIAEANRSRVHSPEEIARATQTLRNYMATHKHPCLGVKESDERRVAKNEMMNEYYKTHSNPKIGVPLKEESKNKIAEGRAKNGLTYKVRCIETGKEYSSANKAATDLGRSCGSTIINCCKGKSKMSFGYHWEFVGNIEDIKIPVAGKKRKVICVETNKIYESLAEAARELNVDKSNIYRSCKDNIKTVRGYHFNYYEE